jgi:hypothetical protein
MMRLGWALAAAVMLAGLAQAAPARSLDNELIGLEKQSWVAWQGHDQDFFRRFLSDDHVEMTPGGPSPEAGVVASLGGACTVKSYQVDRFKVTRFSADMALVTYRAAQDTTCGSAKVPSPVWATSLFVKRAGRWQNALYVHSPAAEAPAKPAS